MAEWIMWYYRRNNMLQVPSAAVKQIFRSAHSDYGWQSKGSELSHVTSEYFVYKMLARHCCFVCTGISLTILIVLSEVKLAPLKVLRLLPCSSSHYLQPALPTKRRHRKAISIGTIIAFSQSRSAVTLQSPVPSFLATIEIETSSKRPGTVGRVSVTFVGQGWYFKGPSDDNLYTLASALIMAWIFGTFARLEKQPTTLQSVSPHISWLNLVEYMCCILPPGTFVWTYMG